jgi:hypothetical protein
MIPGLAGIGGLLAAAGSVGGPAWGNPISSNLKLLIGGNGTDGSASILDESQSARAITVLGNAQIDTAQSRFGSGSVLFDGAGDALTAASHADFNFGSGPFTVGFFLRQPVATDCAYIGNSDGVTGWRMRRQNGVVECIGLVGFFWAPTPNSQHLLVAERNAAGVRRVYIDGVMKEKATNATAFGDSSLALAIGKHAAGDFAYLAGHMDDIFVVKGQALFDTDANFTVPTVAFPRG